MPNWKIAKAFWRAARTPDPESRETARNIYQTLADKSFHDSEFAKAQTRAAVDADELNSKATYFENKYGGNRLSRSKFRDALEDDLTDRQLVDDFDREFDDAIARHSDRQPASDRGADADDIRNIAIDMLQNGSDISDVLRLLRGE